MLSFSLGRTIWRTIRSFTVLSKSCIFLVNMNLNKTTLQSTYLIFLFSLLFAIVEFKAFVKTPFIKRSKQKDKLNHRLVLQIHETHEAREKNDKLTPSNASVGPLSKRLRTDLQQILSGRFFEERAERLENQLKDLSFNFHHDFTKKLVQFAEQTNVNMTYLFLSFETEL